MKVQCPKNKEHLVSLSDTHCPQCRAPVTFGAALKEWWNRLTLFQCPNCDGEYPLFSVECPRCEQKLTLSVSIANISSRAKQSLQRIRSSGAVSLRLQRLYLLLSIAFVFAAFGPVSDSVIKAHLLRAATSAVHLGIIAFLLRWFLPVRVIQLFKTNTTWLVKSGIFLNHFAVLVFFQPTMVDWKGRSIVLAALFVLTWCGGVLLTALSAAGFKALVTSDIPFHQRPRVNLNNYRGNSYPRN